MENPDWNKGDTLKSLHGVLNLGRVAAARVITYISELPSRVDTREANILNGVEDE